MLIEELHRLAGDGGWVARASRIRGCLLAWVDFKAFNSGISSSGTAYRAASKAVAAAAAAAGGAAGAAKEAEGSSGGDVEALFELPLVRQSMVQLANDATADHGSISELLVVRCVCVDVLRL